MQSEKHLAKCSTLNTCLASKGFFIKVEIKKIYFINTRIRRIKEIILMLDDY